MSESYNYALCLAYRGGEFRGVQSQSDPTGAAYFTIEHCVREAFSGLKMPISLLVLAARTDKGVSASYQLIQIQSPVHRDTERIKTGLLRFLPSSIRVFHVQRMPPEFHARNSALGRYYRYLIYNGPLRRFEPEDALWVKAPLDVAAMNKAARPLWGEHDFSAFRSADCQSVSPWRNLYFLSVRRAGDWVCVDLGANAFVQRMVRNLTGALIQVGLGAKGPEFIGQRLSSKSRREADVGADASGLYLYGVEYESSWGLPPFEAALEYLPKSFEFPLLSCFDVPKGRLFHHG